MESPLPDMGSVYSSVIEVPADDLFGSDGIAGPGGDVIFLCICLPALRPCFDLVFGVRNSIPEDLRDRDIGIMEKLKLAGKYLNQPVKMEGILQRKLDGTVRLGDTVIPGRTIIEFVQNGDWNIGILIQDPQTKQYRIHDMVSGDKVLVEKIEQLQARVRMYKRRDQRGPCPVT